MKLKCDEPLSNFAFKFNLRRYATAFCGEAASREMRHKVQEFIFDPHEYPHLCSSAAEVGCCISAVRDGALSLMVGRWAG